MVTEMEFTSQHRIEVSQFAPAFSFFNLIFYGPCVPYRGAQFNRGNRAKGFNKLLTRSKKIASACVNLDMKYVRITPNVLSNAFAPFSLLLCLTVLIQEVVQPHVLKFRIILFLHSAHANIKWDRSGTVFGSTFTGDILTVSSYVPSSAYPSEFFYYHRSVVEDRSSKVLDIWYTL
uniref:Uncharacterized protein n=1 Tax=Solanum lycopersicum TaxID=4081 RepID=A0A3Q7IJ68_SOLLC